MYTPAIASALAVSLLPFLTAATPVATPVPQGSQNNDTLVARQNPTQAPDCSGLGSGPGYDTLMALVNQIDTSKVYAIPFSSENQGWTGVTTWEGDPSMTVNFEKPDGSVDDSTTGTIDGDLMKSSFTDLANAMGILGGDSPTCFSSNGQYWFNTGSGCDCGEAGGP